MNMTTSRKSFIALILVISICFSMPAHSSAAIVEGGQTVDTAYNCGQWSEGKMISATMNAGVDDAYFKFTVNNGDRIYVNCGYKNQYEGMSVRLLDSTELQVDRANSPDEVIKPNTLLAFLPLDCDGTRDSQTFYIHVARNNVPSTLSMTFTIGFYNRIKTGSASFNISGTARNSGNTSGSSAGMDSTALRLDLTRSTAVPERAVVTSISTSGRQTPTQGNVRHALMPAQPGLWYTSVVKSADSGIFDVTVDDGIVLKQVWQFRYNALAPKSSTMTNINVKYNYEYDISFNNYTIFIK